LTNPPSRASICIKVSKSYGEKSIRTAATLGIIDKTLNIQRNSDFLYIPLKRELARGETDSLSHNVPEYQISTHDFSERRRTPRTLMECLKDELAPNLLVSLPHSMDIIGDIAIIEIPDELQPHEGIIGKAILSTHKNVETVLAKASPVEGEFRTRQFQLIAGENKTITTHKENGCQYFLDITKAYFSPRLSNEHKRIANLTKESEMVVDLFAGVGPFVILIAKTHSNVKVYAVDANPDAITFLKKNVRLNRVENKVYPMLGDAKKIAEQHLVGIADRVIMNLPEKAIEFVEPACKTLKPKGGNIHFYCFMSDRSSLENNKDDLINSVEKAGRKITTISSRLVRSTAPHQWQVAFDAKVH
jgi:tRNA (guanine37-N1)-methyltransferase